MSQTSAIPIQFPEQYSHWFESSYCFFPIHLNTVWFPNPVFWSLLSRRWDIGAISQIHKYKIRQQITRETWEEKALSAQWVSAWGVYVVVFFLSFTLFTLLIYMYLMHLYNVLLENKRLAKVFIFSDSTTLFCTVTPTGELCVVLNFCTTFT